MAFFSRRTVLRLLEGEIQGERSFWASFSRAEGLLKLRFRRFRCLSESEVWQIFWLAVAILGSILTARSDLKAQCAGATCSVGNQMLGDFLAPLAGTWHLVPVLRRLFILVYA